MSSCEDIHQGIDLDWQTELKFKYIRINYQRLKQDILIYELGEGLRTYSKGLMIMNLETVDPVQQEEMEHLMVHGMEVVADQDIQMDL